MTVQYAKRGEGPLWCHRIAAVLCALMATGTGWYFCRDGYRCSERGTESRQEQAQEKVQEGTPRLFMSALIMWSPTKNPIISTTPPPTDQWQHLKPPNSVEPRLSRNTPALPMAHGLARPDRLRC